MCCVICGNDEVTLHKVGGSWWCDACEDADREMDIEQFEADKRQRIAEQNEY